MVFGGGHGFQTSQDIAASSSKRIGRLTGDRPGLIPLKSLEALLRNLLAFDAVAKAQS